MSLHKEISFETEICDALAASGWLYAEQDAKQYDRTRALFPADVIAWVQETHHHLKNLGKRTLPLGEDGGYPKLDPLSEAGSGMVQQKLKAYLAEIIAKVPVRG